MISQQEAQQKAQQHHWELMGDEEGEHAHSNTWDDCPGCENDNPFFAAAKGE